MENNLSKICFVMGFLSIIGSIIIWATAKGTSSESLAHAERFGVFVGLWAPTFFALSVKLTGMEKSTVRVQTNN